MKYQSVHQFLQHVSNRNPGQPEFLQAVTEVMGSLWPFIEKHPKYAEQGVLAINSQIAPPTINLDEPDEGCDLDFVPHTPREMPIDVVLSNSFGFGGTNGSLVFRRYAE